MTVSYFSLALLPGDVLYALRFMFPVSLTSTCMMQRSNHHFTFSQSSKVK